MKLATYRNQLIAFSVWLVVVVALFKLVSDRQIAATIAGFGFVTLPTYFLGVELFKNKNKVHMLSLSVFLFFAALPMFLLRIFNWGVEFETLSLFGVSATLMHKYSNTLYFLMLATCLYQLVLEKRAKK